MSAQRPNRWTGRIARVFGVMAAAMSETRPVQTPIARIGSSMVAGAMPAMPMALLASAPMMPATRVPCQELGAVVVQPAF